MRGSLRTPRSEPRRLLLGSLVFSVVLHQNPTAHKLRKRPDEKAVIKAYLQPGIIAELEDCIGEWCNIRVSSYRGWIPRVSLWGVYPHEFAEK